MHAQQKFYAFLAALEAIAEVEVLKEDCLESAHLALDKARSQISLAEAEIQAFFESDLTSFEASLWHSVMGTGFEPSTAQSSVTVTGPEPDSTSEPAPCADVAEGAADRARNTWS